MKIIADGVLRPGLPRGYPTASCPDREPEPERRKRYEMALLPNRTYGHDWPGAIPGVKVALSIENQEKQPVHHILFREAVVEAMCRTFSVSACPHRMGGALVSVCGRMCGRTSSLTL